MALTSDTSVSGSKDKTKSSRKRKSAQPVHLEDADPVTDKPAPKPKRKKNWSHDETVGLIAIWGSRDHQDGFEGMMYNSRVWASILDQFLTKFPQSPYTTWESLKDRIDYLRRKYRDAKKINNTSGRGRETSPYYTEIDQIIGKNSFTIIMNDYIPPPFCQAGVSKSQSLTRGPLQNCCLVKNTS